MDPHGLPPIFFMPLIGLAQLDPHYDGVLPQAPIDFIIGLVISVEVPHGFIEAAHGLLDIVLV